MLDVKSLYVSYNGHDVIQDIGLSVSPGEILAIIGPNGAGKSTLIRAISGVITPRRGAIQVQGVDIARLSPMQTARYLAVVPQARQLPGAYTVYQTVLLGRTPYLSWLGKAGKNDHARVRLALEWTQTSNLAGRQISKLSGGEQQRVLLARALAQDTPILLLDEPTTHLDLEHQSSLLNLIRDLAARNHLSVLMVLHDLNLAGLYASRVALMVDGQIVADGPPEEVLTAARLSEVYNVPVNVIPHPEYGTPLIIPDGKLEGDYVQEA